MRVLMIGLSDGILRNPLGDVRERHEDYARRVGNLEMIVYSPCGRNLETSRLTSHLTVYPSRSRSPWHFVYDAIKIGCRIIEKDAVDLITTQDPFSTGLVGYFLKKRYGIPLEVQNHSDFIDNRIWIAERPYRNWFLNAIGKLIVRRADSLRVINKKEAHKYFDLGVPEKRVQLQPTPVNLARFEKFPLDGEVDKLRKRLGLRENERVVLWVGRPVGVKWLSLWLEVVKLVQARCDGVRGVIAGDLKFAPELPACAKRMGLENGVIFTGYVPHEDLPAYFTLADVYLHTSIYEGLGKVMVEAGIAGKAVVSTPTAGAKEVVKNNVTGLIAEAEPQVLANAVTDVLENPQLARKMGDSARELVSKKFDRETSVRNIIERWQLTAEAGVTT